jgi:GLPGLI family protein
MRRDCEVKEFILEFDKNQSVNYQKEIVSPDLKYSYRNAFYYQNKSESLYLRTEDDAMFGKITITDSIKSTWKLTNETKLINNILCYKATQEAQDYRGSDWGRKYKVVTWYAPEISAPFGLFEYGGLPGLILELQIRNVTYGADKIVLKPMKNSKLKRPKKQGKVMTEKEFLDKFMEIMQRK